MPKKKPFSKLKCSECGRVNYFTKKSKDLAEKKLELKKFCKWCRKHTIHKEARKGGTKPLSSKKELPKKESPKKELPKKESPK